MSEIPTPRTDAAAIAVCLNWDNQGDHVRYLVPIVDARQLERELAAARAQVATLREAFKTTRELVTEAISEAATLTDNTDSLVDSQLTPSLQIIDAALASTPETKHPDTELTELRAFKDFVQRFGDYWKGFIAQKTSQ